MGFYADELIGTVTGYTWIGGNPPYLTGVLAHHEPEVGRGLTVWKYDHVLFTVVSDEVLATGDGSETHFSGVLANFPIGYDAQALTITTLVGGNPVEIQDAGGVGVFDGDGSGTINYETGEWDVTWNDPPDLDADILASYEYYGSFESLQAVDDGDGNIIGDTIQPDSFIVYDTGEFLIHFYSELWPGSVITCSYNEGVLIRDIALRNSLALALDVALRNQLTQEIVRDFTLMNKLTELLARDFGLRNRLLDIDTRVVRDYTLLNALLPEAEAIENTWDVLLGVVSVKDWVKFPVAIAMDSSSFTNTVSLGVVGLDLLATFRGYLRTGAADLIVNINGTLFSFMVEEITVDAAVGARGFSVWGLSKTAKLASRVYSTPITKIWDENVLASAIVTELAPGYTIQFEIDDWVIPANVLSAENEMPMDVIRRVAEASGGIVRSGRLGELILRPSYPVDPALLNVTTVDRSLSQVLDIITVGGKVIRSEGYNSILVEGRDSSLDKSSAIVELDSDKNAGKTVFPPGTDAFVRVYPTPTSMVYDDQVTKGTAVKLATYDVTIEEEKVQVRDGKASVRYPIKSITLLDWDGRALTGETWTVGGKDIVFAVEEGCSGTAVLLITYVTRYDLWRVTSSTEGEVALCVEDDQG